MSVVIVEMSEMSDSKELYQSKPPIACIAFLYVTFALCVAILIWIVTGNINLIIKGNAKVVSSEATQVFYQLEVQEKIDKYWIEIPISSCDIQWVEEGMQVRCSLEALPTYEYGYVQGEVMEIVDQLYIDNNGQGYYIVKACLESSVLTGSNGKEVSLQDEMIGEASILAGEQKVLNYLQDCMK